MMFCLFLIQSTDNNNMGSLTGIPMTVDRGPQDTWGEVTRNYVKAQRRAWPTTFRGQVYNFLERPTGWKCIIYHVSV